MNDPRTHVYEGALTLHPAGRGATLEDTAGGGQLPATLAEWVEEWVDRETGLIKANETGPVRITIEYLGDRKPRARRRPTDPLDALSPLEPVARERRHALGDVPAADQPMPTQEQMRAAMLRARRER